MSILLFILTLLPMSSNSLSINIIDRYTLSNQVVNDMVEDEDGYIWIGTRRGLNRFNGSTYKYYCHTFQMTSFLYSARILTDDYGSEQL